MFRSRRVCMIIFFLFWWSTTAKFYGSEVSLFVGVFLVDSASYYLSWIILCFFVVLFFWAPWDNINGLLWVCLWVSLISSVYCFRCANLLLFWWFYEITVLSLLQGFYSSCSYPERYNAGWYLSGYVFVGGLAMFVSLLYIVVASGTSWIEMGFNNGFYWSEVILFLVFISKVPLFPFHAWLPVVHAEAVTPVSVALSGYVMKLGIIGVARFCENVLFFNSTLLMLVLAAVFPFFIGCLLELDVKRWLAFLSLAHIPIGLMGVIFCTGSLSNIPYIFCLGHGLSAALLFWFFGTIYDTIGSRNWLVIFLNNNGSFMWRGLLFFCICSACSLPPSISFLSEIITLSQCFRGQFFLWFFLFLFVSGLVPLVILSYCLINLSFSSKDNYSVSSVVSIWIFFVFWLVFGFAL